jgi:hypothetical protein
MNMFYAFFLSLQLKKCREEQLEKFYPNLISTQNLGLVSADILIPFGMLIIVLSIIC